MRREFNAANGLSSEATRKQVNAVLVTCLVCAWQRGGDAACTCEVQTSCAVRAVITATERPAITSLSPVTYAHT